MENNDFGSFKELYDCFLKTTYKIEINGKTYEPGETIAVFDKIQMATFEEDVRRAVADGGYDNRGFIYWETTKDIQLVFSQGVFSKLQYAISSNSSIEEVSEITVSKQEKLESNDRGEINLSKVPISFSLFIYNLKGEKIPFTLKKQVATIEFPFTEVIVNYEFATSNATKVIVGKQLLNGFLTLEAKTRVKDDTTGKVVTGVIKIPRLKLFNDLSLRLGKQGSPVVANFKAIGVPVGGRRNSYVMETCFLNEDLDSDM